MKRVTLLMLGLALTQSGCVVVGGYSSRGGWFIWPGSFGFLLLAALLYFVFRRR